MRIFSSPRLKDFWNKARGVSIQYDLGEYGKILAAIDRLGIGRASDQELRERAARLKDRARRGEPPEDLLVETFALVRGAAGRRIGLRPYDEQVLAGLDLQRGRVVEMDTGEGKTLAAVFPTTLSALDGRGVHVLTFNDYLARRDAAWMGPIYEGLGLSVGCVQEGMAAADRKRAYAADVTYATAKEAGFDYLRDHLCYARTELVQRPFRFAIVDEADSLLIDEARVPLVIAGRLEADEDARGGLAETVKGLRRGVDFDTDEGERNLVLSDEGLRTIVRRLGGRDLHAPGSLDLLTRVHQALHAEYLLRRDVDYIVRGGRVEIVDEFTGRVVADRHWPDGLQAAVEAKERLRPGAGGAVLGSITLQHFLRLYPRLAGLTATARSAVDELREFYGLETVVIPPHRPSIRRDLPDAVFTHRAAKTAALIEEIGRCRALGRPVLVGTVSVRESEELAAALAASGIEGRVLNAKNDELEAEVVAAAGRPGAVTISTNMAGRGTDIKLGGPREEERDRVVALGGLYVIGTNRHESLRIDRQLRGRAGRQGDPGSSRFFISLEDPLVDKYGLRNLLPNPLRRLRRDGPLESSLAAREIARGQRIIEGQNFEIRKTLWKYAYLPERQRQIIHGRREDILDGGGLPEPLRRRFRRVAAGLRARLSAAAWEDLERRIALREIDRAWREHLAVLADVREGIHLASVGGRSPLAEFQRIANEEFVKLEPRVEAGILRAARELPKDPGLIDPGRIGLRGPSSTWTYLISDDPFGSWVSLLQGGNIGATAVAAAVYGPLYLLLRILQRLRRDQDRTARCESGSNQPDSGGSDGSR
jgi:preprotein translocase subunit SecA